MTERKERELALEALANAAVAAQELGMNSGDFAAAAIETWWLLKVHEFENG